MPRQVGYENSPAEENDADRENKYYDKGIYRVIEIRKSHKYGYLSGSSLST